MLRYRYTIFLVAALAALFVGLVSGGRSARAYDGVSYDSEELRFLELLNDHREANGDLPPLVLSDAATEAADKHSEDMGVHEFFDHGTVNSSYFPVGSGPWDRMKATGYDYPNAAKAENVAAGHETAEEVFEAWRDSPGHNRNMLDGSQQVVGVGRDYVPDSPYGWYWTTDFGSEKDPTSHEPGASAAPQDGDDIENGSMDDDSIWEQATKKEGKNLIAEGVARLGGYDSAEDEISQKVRVSEDQELVLRARMTTRERAYLSDRLLVVVRDEDRERSVVAESRKDDDVGRTYMSAWIEESVDLSRFAGQTVTVSFVAKTDEQRPTTFLVDDVTLR